MYKNMIRKSLALGAGLALVVSGLAAVPAQAVATGLLWSAFGPTNSMVGVAGHVFSMRIGNPGGVSGDGAADEDELVDLATKVSVTMVENPNVTTIAITPVAVTTLNAASADATSFVVQVGAVDSTGTHSATGLIEIAPPTVLTHSIQVDVQVTYDDGSKSETERVTFLPAKSVSASVSIAPVAVSDNGARTGNSFRFAGINNGNFVASNFTVIGNADTATAGQIAVVLNNSVGDAGNTSAFDYLPLTDSHAFTYSDAIVAGDVLTAQLFMHNGASVDANTFFDAASTKTTVSTFTVSAADAYASMDISVATSATVIHNKGVETGLITAETVVAEEGTKSLNFVIQLFTDAGRTTAAGAGNAVTVALTDVDNKIGTTTITSEGRSLNVTGSQISFTKTSNSSGQIAFTVAADKAIDGESFVITAVGSLAGISLDPTTVKYQEAAFTLLPAIDGNFTIAPQGSIAVDYIVVNQFGALANADHQLTFSRARASGTRTVAQGANWSYVAPVSATGRASVTIVDNGAAAIAGTDTVTVALQKKATSGAGFLSVAGATDTFNLSYNNSLTSSKVSALTNFNGIANAAGAVLAPLKLETKTLVDYDGRLAGVKPSFDTDGTGVKGNVPNSVVGAATTTYTGTGMLRVFGVVQTAANAPIAGVAVKISGTGANFANASTIAEASLMKNDSIVVFTDSTGSYEAFVRSSVAGTQTISIDAQGVLGSTQVRFQESTGVAATMTVDMPASVNPGARADIVATVVDKFGKPVAGVDVFFSKIGPGVLNAATIQTDPFGRAVLTLSTLAAESGVTKVTVYATLGGVTTVVNKDINVGASSSVATGGKVNVGSFNGKLVIYAAGLDGAKISWKVAGKWAVANASGNLLNRFDRPVGASGVNVNVEIYVNGVKQLTKTVLTR